MGTKRFVRKLTAIVSADVVGYSKLMGDDEAATVETLTVYQNVMSALIKQYRGRVIDSPGDNMLSEFASVVDAVQCAVAIQKELKSRNAGLAENRNMRFRIGINLGDVIEEDGRIYGDGVNIAARLEAMADPGGICVSKTAFDQIETKLPLGYEYLGEQSVKNISKPVGAYRVLMQPRVTNAGKPEAERSPNMKRKPIILGAAAIALLAVCVGIWQFYLHRPAVELASVENMIYPLPDKPSIAVLPFVNMSNDPDQEYFSDGLSEEIITALSNLPEMFVIARNSAFTYKGKPVKIRQIAEDLGVRYVLEGSVRKDQSKVRVTAQLIDALSGRHLWAERYDRDLVDIFALQDELTTHILSALEVRLTDGEQALLQRRGTDNLQTYLKLLQGIHLIYAPNPEDVINARLIFEEIIAQEPLYASAYVLLARTYWLEVFHGTSKSPIETLRRGAEILEKSLSIDEFLGGAYALLGHITIMRRDWERGVSLLNQAVELEPNGADANYYMGLGLNFSGRPGEGLPFLKKAIRLNPISPAGYLNAIAISYRMIGSYEKAIAYLEKSTQQYPKHLFSHLNLSACYLLVGRPEEAGAQAKEVLNLNPKFSLAKFDKMLPLKDQEEKKRFIGALKKAFAGQSGQ